MLCIVGLIYYWIGVFMFEEMALNYFRGLSKGERNRLVKRIFNSLSDEEKLELAKVLVGKKK